MSKRHYNNISNNSFLCKDEKNSIESPVSNSFENEKKQKLSEHLIKIILNNTVPILEPSIINNSSISMTEINKIVCNTNVKDFSTSIKSNSFQQTVSDTESCISSFNAVEHTSTTGNLDEHNVKEENSADSVYWTIYKKKFISK